jgi:lantibiotic modifying enzyme
MAAVDEAAPLLRGVLDCQVRRFTAATAELCDRICRNRDSVAKELFGARDTGRLTAISSQMGDSHNGGRRTMVIACEAGRFVYKPHDCRIDAWFATIARNYVHGALAQPHTIVCEDSNSSWGVQQHMERQPVVEKSGVARFWRNMGGAIALFQALGSEDLHCENFVAVGEHPSLVDVETVLTCKPDAPDNPLTNPNLNHAQNGFERDVALTLVASGLMPSPSGEADNTSPLLAHGYNCLPVLGDAERDVRGYEDDLLDGFDEGWAMLAERREELTRDVRRAANLPVRCIIRNTDLYAKLIRRLKRPDAYALPKREALLEQLRGPLERDDKPALLDLATSEMACLRQGDIPYFQAMAGSHTVVGSDGTTSPHVLKSSAMERALVRIATLDKAHRTFGREVFDANLRRAYLPDGTSVPPRDPHAAPLDSAEAIAAAEEVFLELERLVLVAPSGEESWLFRNTRYGILMSSTVGMADGLGGVAVFLAALAPRTKNGRVRERALLRLDGCLDRVDDAVARLEKAELIPEASVPLGLASGFGGFVRSLDYMVRELGGHASFGAEAERAQGLLSRMLSVLERYDFEHARHADVYDGLSGLLLALGECQSARHDPRMHVAVERLTRRLLEIRSPAAKDGTLLWDARDAAWPVSGFGHGQAGIAAALAIAAEAFGLDATDAVRDALAWEVHVYDEKLGTWPDLRTAPVSTTYMHGICSGAPGIGIASLLAIRLEDASVRELASTLLELADSASLALAPPSRDTLCCGGLAVAEYMLSRNLREETGRLIAGTVGRRRTLGGYVFVRDGMRMVSEPDLFNGLSGVGYTLLRYADPKTSGLFTP